MKSGCHGQVCVKDSLKIVAKSQKLLSKYERRQTWPVQSSQHNNQSDTGVSSRQPIRRRGVLSATNQTPGCGRSSPLDNQSDTGDRGVGWSTPLDNQSDTGVWAVQFPQQPIRHRGLGQCNGTGINNTLQASWPNVEANINFVQKKNKRTTTKNYDQRDNIGEQFLKIYDLSNRD